MRNAFTSLQSDFVRALLDPDANVPADIAACHPEDALRRFNIYRNNVAVGLRDALAARFSVTQQIVGADFFHAMARVYIKTSPPASPIMMFYGETFPDFIASFEAAHELAYLSDVARLEAACTRAYHAADTEPLDSSVLRSLRAEDLTSLCVRLHPSLQIISSDHPIVTIFEMHQGIVPLGEIADWRTEDALVVRPHLDVEVRLLPVGGAAFLTAIKAHCSLAAAAEAAIAAHPAFDLSVNLAGLFSAGLAATLSH